MHFGIDESKFAKTGYKPELRQNTAVVFMFYLHFTLFSCLLSVLAAPDQNVRHVVGMEATISTKPSNPLRRTLSKVERESIYQPDRGIAFSSVGPFNRLGAEIVKYKSGDGTDLHAYYVPPSVGKDDTVYAVLYFHGSNLNNSHFLTEAERWREKLGFFNGKRTAFFLPSYRGYGLSQGTPSEQGLYEDGKASIAQFRDLLWRDKVTKYKMIVFGWSLGGAVAIDLLSKLDPDVTVDALILEGTFTSMLDVAADTTLRVVKHAPWLFTERWDSIKKISKLPKDLPIIFISGDRDKSGKYSRRLCEAVDKVKHSKTFRAVIPCGDHLNTRQQHEYLPVVSRFLEVVIGEKSFETDDKVLPISKNCGDVGKQDQAECNARNLQQH